MHHRQGATLAVIGKTARHRHTMKPHWFFCFVYSCLSSCWNSAAQQLQRRSSSWNACTPLGPAMFLRKWSSRRKQRALVEEVCFLFLAFMYGCWLHLSSSSCWGQWLMLQQGPRDKQNTSWRPPTGLGSGLKESGSHWHPSYLWFIIIFTRAKGWCLLILWKLYNALVHQIFP